jgi:hypothetical protein
MSGVVQTPSTSPFPGDNVEPNPVPGGSGTGVGSSGFSDFAPAGPVFALGAFMNPWG